MRSFILTLCFIFAFIHSLFCQEPFIRPAQVRQLDSIARQDVPARSPGIATGIVKNGRIVYRNYAGYANLADSVLIDEHSRFNIASNAKQFTALAILLLAAQNRLSLDDDIRTFFPELFAGIGHRILIRHLLNHSSGIRDVYDLWSLQGITWWKTTLTNQDVLTLLRRQNELNFKPGSAYLYSNSNYILLAQIVEQVAKEPFVTYTRKLFDQLGMQHTSFVDNHNAIAEPVAKPYFNFDRWVNYDWLCDIHGDGNLFTTLADQLTWEKIIQTGHHHSLPPGLIRRSQQPLENSRITAYGYGLEFGLYKGIPYRFHEGATGAWKATLIRFPADSLSLITVTNSGKTIPAMQTRQMADVLLTPNQQTITYPEPTGKTGDFVSVTDISGIYLDASDQDASSFSFRFEQRDTSLYLARFGRNDVRLVRESATTFHQATDTTFRLAFKKVAGSTQATAYHPTHAPYTLQRITHDWRGFTFERINGVYRNEETSQKLTINHLSGQQFRVTLGDSERAGYLVSPTKLLCDGFQLTLTNGRKPATLFLDLNRIRKVRFTAVNK